MASAKLRAVVVRRRSGLRAAIETNPGRGLVYRANSGAWTNEVPLGGDVVAAADPKEGLTFGEALAFFVAYKRQQRVRNRAALGS